MPRMLMTVYTNEENRARLRALLEKRGDITIYPEYYDTAEDRPGLRFVVSDEVYPLVYRLISNFCEEWMDYHYQERTPPEVEKTPWLHYYMGFTHHNNLFIAQIEEAIANHHNQCGFFPEQVVVGIWVPETSEFLYERGEQKILIKYDFTLGQHRFLTMSGNQHHQMNGAN